MMNKIDIQYQDILLNWRHLMTKHHLPDAYRTATNRAKSTKRRHRLIDKNGNRLGYGAGCFDRLRRNKYWRAIPAFVVLPNVCVSNSLFPINS